MTKIKKVFAREILTSLGTPTVEATVVLENGQTATSSAPTGVSISKHEVLELRDNDEDRFNGLGVLKAIANVNQKISQKIAGFDPTKQTKVDQALVDLDGTSNKANLGANAILAVSQAVLKAGALVNQTPVYQYLKLKYGLGGEKIKIPTPIFSLINGGLHGAGNLDFQEFHIVPTSQKNYSEALRLGVEIYAQLKDVLIHRNAIHSLGDDGGFAPDLFTNADALEVMVQAIKESRYRLAEDVFLGLDVAASFFYHNEKYQIRDESQALTAEGLIKYYKKLNRDYHLFYLEDPLWEDDWQNWRRLKEAIGATTTLVGDDLLATNKERVKKAIQEKACGAILIKPNQVGTISETVAVVKIAREADWLVIISHRSGETNDDFIADFSVGIGADYTKFGAPARGERVAKYNRLLAIEEEI